MLEVKDLVKTFGNYTAVDHVFPNPRWKNHGANWPKRGWEDNDFSFDLGFLTQDQGEVLWNGHHLGEKDYDVIGYLPEERDFIRK